MRTTAKAAVIGLVLAACAYSLDAGASGLEHGLASPDGRHAGRGFSLD